MQNIPTGTGLGFRRELIPELKVSLPSNIDFFEIAPENWMGMGGQFEADLRYFSQRIPFVCHGLSLSLGGTSPLDVTLSARRTHRVEFEEFPSEILVEAPYLL